jgi:hypothetical protein
VIRLLAEEIQRKKAEEDLKNAERNYAELFKTTQEQIAAGIKSGVENHLNLEEIKRIGENDKQVDDHVTTKETLAKDTTAATSAPATITRDKRLRTSTKPVEKHLEKKVNQL